MSVHSVILHRLMASVACGAMMCGGAFAQTAANIDAANLVNGFSTLNNTAAGQTVLQQNLSTSIGINNNSSVSVRNQAISDNTIASLIGTLSNGISVGDGLGTQLYAAYLTKNSANKNFSSTSLSANFSALFNQLNTINGAGDSAFTKNYFANGSRDGNPTHPAAGISLPAGGIFNVYDVAYKPLPGNANTVGDSRPYQVAPNQIQTFTGSDFFGTSTNTATDILPTLKSNASFPSGHAAIGDTSSLLLAMMVPERFQQELTRGAEFANSRIVLGAHYSLDIIGARIQTLYDTVQALNNNAKYTNQTLPGLLGGTITTTNDFQALFTAAQSDLRSLLNSACTGGISVCAASTAGDRFANGATNKANYSYWLTYGLSPVGPTNLDAVVPVGAEVLLATRFPYLSAAQRRDVLGSTEIASGQALDNGSGYARLNLYTAADGYGSFNGAVTVTMDASKGGFNAYDTWRNDIGDYKALSTGIVTPGSLLKNGSGTLELAGNNSWSGSTTVNQGALVFSGTSKLGGPFINNSVVSTTLQDGTAGRALTVGSYTGGAGSQLLLGTQVGGPGSKSDVLMVTGGVSMSSSTTIIVYDTTPTAAGAYNPDGILLVNVAKGQSATVANFSLAGGPIHKGLFDYNLVFNSDPQWLLVGLPSADAFRLAAVVSGAHSIWFDTTGVWADRQTDLRDVFGAGKGGKSSPIWVKAFGEWTTRNETQNIASYSSTISANASYKQDTQAVLGGVDGGQRDVVTSGDTLLVGLMGGYINSNQKFTNSSTRANFEGGSVGVSATYLNRGFFIDTAFKADILHLGLAAPAVAAFGGSTQGSTIATVGFISDAGYKFEIGQRMFVEPIATLAYAYTSIDQMVIAGANVSFKNEDALRGRLGLRVGGVLSQTETSTLALSGTASWWNRLGGSATATIDSGAGAPLLTLTDKAINDFGEVGLALNYANTANGWSGFVKGNYQFGTGYDATSVEGGMRYNY